MCAEGFGITVSDCFLNKIPLGLKVQTLTAGPVSPLRPRGPGGPIGPGKPFVPSFPEGPTGPGGPYSRGKKSTEDLYFVIGFMVVLWWTPVGTRTHSWSGRPGSSSSTLISSLALKNGHI